MRHAREVYPVRVRKGGVDELLVFRRGRSAIKVASARALDPTERALVDNSVDYSYVFGSKAATDLPSEAALDDLATALRARPYRSGDSDIPAGYTYLGQFIFHDLTWMKSAAKSLRTPSLDLDSVLPSLKSGDTPERCTPDGLFKIGETSDTARPEDLPRNQVENDPERGKPLIADLRNDDFLPLAQCHVLLLKFYNAAARCLGYDGGDRSDAWWEKLKTTWLEHFQSIVLHDYLPRVVDCDTYWDVRTNKRKIVRTAAFAADLAWLPIEFAGAVGRFGHSMIRDGYGDWNCKQDWDFITVQHFMAFSYANSGDRLKSRKYKVPLDWASNWLQMFDFSEFCSSHKPMMGARIDTFLANDQLGKLPGCLLDEMCCPNSQKQPFDLASLTMRRGRELELVSAQEAVQQAGQMLGKQLPLLSTEQLFPKDEGLYELATEVHPMLSRATPLWFYILREAEVLGAGRLGPLGARIVMETLHAAIDVAGSAVLDPAWQATFPSKDKHQFTMPDLILLSANPDPLAEHCS